MLKISLLILVALVVAIGGGAGSAWFVLGTQDGLGAVKIGGWTAFPDVGAPDADPYSKARITRDGILTLGRGEGLTFVALHDTANKPLRRGCRYTLTGLFPQARFWTLYAADEKLAALPPHAARPPALHSNELLRRADNSVAITVASHPAPGNWLATSGEGPMALVLTLYDTALGREEALAEIELPDVTNAGCDA